LRAFQRVGARRALDLEAMATLSIAVFQETTRRPETDSRLPGLRPTSGVSKIRTVPEQA